MKERRNLEQTAGCLRCKRTGEEERKRLQIILWLMVSVVKRGGMRLRGQGFKAGSRHWAPCHRCSCPHRQCSRLEKAQGQQRVVRGERRGQEEVQNEQEREAVKHFLYRFNILLRCRHYDDLTLE